MSKWKKSIFGLRKKLEKYTENIYYNEKYEIPQPQILQLRMLILIEHQNHSTLLFLVQLGYEFYHLRPFYQNITLKNVHSFVLSALLKFVAAAFIHKKRNLHLSTKTLLFYGSKCGFMAKYANFRAVKVWGVTLTPRFSQ